MEMLEITSEEKARKFLFEEIETTESADAFVDNLPERLHTWAVEFDSLQREIKRRDVNQYKLNRIISLYLLITTATYFLPKFKEVVNQFA